MKKLIIICGLLVLWAGYVLKEARVYAQDVSYPDSETYLIASKNIFWASDSFERRKGYKHIVYNLDGIFIAQAGVKDSLKKAANFTQSCPLLRPLDSLMVLYFRSTRRIKRAAFILSLSDTCRIRSLVPFEFQVLHSPLKEINIFAVNHLEQNEFYFEINLQQVKLDSGMAEFLFFEYLLQQFFNKKVLSDKIYTEPVLAALANAYRPVYAPELHFYLDAKAADEVIRKWVKIKRTFVNRLKNRKLDKPFARFREKLKLITETPHSKLVVWTKLMSRYGYQGSLVQLLSDKEKFLARFQKQLPIFIKGLQLIWLRSAEMDKNLAKALQKEKIEGGVRIFTR